MQVEVFALCDAATGDRGKLSILGAFDTIWMEQIPSVHPQCSIALRMRLSRIERGVHKIKVSFLDADGRKVIPDAEGNINVSFSDEQTTGSSNFILNIQGLKLERFGEHSIDLAVDGQLQATVPLYVKQVPGAQKK